MVKLKHKQELSKVVEKMIRDALQNNNEWINGKSLGPKPRFFVVGDEPTLKDYLTTDPFSGPGQVMLTQLVQTLDERYEGVKMEDLHITYMIKTTFQKHQLSESVVFDEWLPIIQLEYHLSGCDEIIPLGRVAQLFAANIAQEPEVLQKFNAGVEERAKADTKALAESEALARAETEAKEKYNRSLRGRIANAWKAFTYGN